jgi:WD40 repeat protein
LTTPPTVIQGHTGTIASLDFDPTNTRLATASWDRTCRIWNLADGTMVGDPIDVGDGVTSVAFSPDGAWLLSGDDKGIARLWNTARPGVDESLLLAGHEGGVTAATFSPDGLKVVTGSSDRRARLWHLHRVEGGGDSSRARLQAVAPLVLTQDNNVSVVRFSEDGTRLLTAYDDGGARIWSSDAREPRLLGIHDGRVDSVGFNRDGTRVLTASADKTARVWDANTGEELRKLEGHGASVAAVAVAPDGIRIITGSDNTVRCGSGIRRREGAASRRSVSACSWPASTGMGHVSSPPSPTTSPGSGASGRSGSKARRSSFGMPTGCSAPHSAPTGPGSSRRRRTGP